MHSLNLAPQRADVVPQRVRELDGKADVDLDVGLGRVDGWSGGFPPPCVGGGGSYSPPIPFSDLWSPYPLAPLLFRSGKGLF